MPNHNPVTEQRLSKMLDATEDQGLKSVYVGEGVVFNKNLIRQSGFNQAEQWLSRLTRSSRERVRERALRLRFKRHRIMKRLVPYKRFICSMESLRIRGKSCY